MNSTSDKDSSVAWSFWAACVLAAAGGVAPLALGAGFGSRISGVLLPFAFAAAAMAVNALFHQYGRLFTILVYFVSGIAIVYGVLGMVAVKLTLMIAGSCEPAPAACPPGFERPLTSSEETAINVVIVLGGLALLAGFFGLMVVYRRRPALWQTATPAPTPAPPAAPVAAKEKAAEKVPAAADPPAAQKVSAPADSEPADELKELPAPEEPMELPAPEEPKELPPPA